MKLPRALLAPLAATALGGSLLAGPALAFAGNPFAERVAAVPPAPVGQAPFLWGVALSGFQNDGPVPAMDWYALDKNGRFPERCGQGPDFRGHMDEDLDRAQSLGINAFRTSLEWARLEPTPGHWDAAEVAYTHRLLAGIRQRGMTPIITLHHFATPRWVYDDKTDDLLAWENPHTAEAYLRYVDFVVKEFGRDIDWYLTFNEPSTLIGGGYVLGWVLPYHHGPMPLYHAAMNIIRAHVGAYRLIHQANPRAMVSMPDYNTFLSIANAGVDYMPTEILSVLLDKAVGWDGQERVRDLDFVALHYYGTSDAGTLSTFPVQPWRWGVNPGHFADVLKAYYERLHLPILVAENGFATENGSPRPDGWTRERYLVAHVKALQEARAAGIPVLGYLYWTLTDNYEWGTYAPRFGLWSVDVRHHDLRRLETPAAGVYRQIIRTHGVSDRLARRYPAPDGPIEGGAPMVPDLR